MQMETNLTKIDNYFISKGVKLEYIVKSNNNPIYLSLKIALYAHKDQKRENGSNYINHPMRCLNNYKELIGIIDDNLHFDVKLLNKYNIPFYGVQELCLLHDVVEDSEFSFDDVRDIFIECGFEDYFDTYISSPLRCITHDKSVEYSEYIKICLKHPTSAIVKLMDLQDNLYFLELVEFNEPKFKRSMNYLKYAYQINCAYNFIENCNKYLNEFNNNINI